MVLRLLRRPSRSSTGFLSTIHRLLSMMGVIGKALVFVWMGAGRGARGRGEKGNEVADVRRMSLFRVVFWLRSAVLCSFLLSSLVHSLLCLWIFSVFVKDLCHGYGCGL